MRLARRIDLDADGARERNQQIVPHDLQQARAAAVLQGRDAAQRLRRVRASTTSQPIRSDW